MPQVFGCPNCQNPFQVPDDAAGKAFQCPSCETTFEVPASEPTPTTPEPEVFGCPHCNGQFGIDASMYGEKLACPHCEELVAIGRVPQKSIVPPVIGTHVEPTTESESSEEPQFEAVEEPQFEAVENAEEPSSDQPANEQLSEPEHETQSEHDSEDSGADADVDQAEAEPPTDPVFEPQPVDHLLPPRFDVPDPVRFPSRLGDEVILPDGAGGYQSVDANIVTITHNGEVFQLKRLTPEQRQRRKLIHNSIAICVAVVLIYLTLRTLGFVS